MASPAGEEAPYAADAPQAVQVRRALARGSVLVAGSQVVAALCRLAVSVTAARLLAPADFGLMGLANLAIATLAALSETGVERAFVQRKDATGYADVAWTLLLGRALLLALILLALASPLAAFYDQPQLLPILAVMALSTAVTGGRNVAAALFNRQLAFDKLFAVEASRALAHVLIGLTLVLWLRNVWALVFTYLANALVEVAISYAIHPHRPRVDLDRGKLSDLLQFGKWITGMTILGLLVTRGEPMFVSKYMGAEALGIYVLAYDIANIPATQITYVLGRVSFPAYARLHGSGDQAALRQAFSRVARTTILLSGAVTVVIAFCIEPLVEHVLGAPWRPAIALVQILVVAGFVRSVAALAGSLFHAVGRPDLDFKMNLSRLLIMVAAIYPACRAWGLPGVALVALCAVASCLPTWLYGVRLFTGYTLPGLLRENALAVVVAAVLAAAFSLARAALPGDALVSAAGQIALALALAGGALLVIERTTKLRVFAELGRLREAIKQ